ncbi:hypothetical protein FB45DRAFT_1020741 [Roridomyces roridus]|uniref:WW domain-containing protein n=1 Tax=Roridomyces roridus TaxID=1738132 RepID=A0AAD7CAW7_9AGAR|nr:hypothetical protein FB45DRAFT_1020741 [Roridomyces roridus]
MPPPLIQLRASWCLRRLLALFVHNFPSGLHYALSILRIAIQRLRQAVSVLSGIGLKPDVGRLGPGIVESHSTDPGGGGYELGQLSHSATQPAEQTVFDVAAVDAALVTRNNKPVGFSSGNGGTANASVSPSATLNQSQEDLDSDRSSVVETIPIFPENFARYYARETISKERSRQYDIPPQTFKFAPLKPPTGWIAPLHSEGARYFYNPGRRIFTDANLCKPQNLANLNRVVELLTKQIQATADELNPHFAALLGHIQDPDVLVDLVIDLEPPTESQPHPSSGWYYFVDHSTRTPFWLQSLAAQQLDIWSEIQGYIEDEQLGHAMEHQYWKHCALFPSALSLTRPLVVELRDHIVFSIGDLSTSLTSTMSRTTDELKIWLTVVNQLEHALTSSPSLSLGSVVAFARYMEQFAEIRFSNFHGLPCARLDQEQSVYKDPNENKSSYLVTFVSPFFFFAPSVYLDLLRMAYLDGRVLMRVWQPLIQRLNSEWQEFIIIATVVLNVNVSFLSINSVDQLGTVHTAAQIMSYLSIVSSIGSILLALLLIRHWASPKFKESAVDLAAALHRRNTQSSGLTYLALIFSLPYTLLIWSTVLFFASFLLTACTRHDIRTQSLVGGSAGILALLVAWCIWDGWDMEHALHKPPALHRIKAAVRERVRMIRIRSPERSKTESTRQALLPRPIRRWTTFLSRQTTHVTPDDVEAGNI